MPMMQPISKVMTTEEIMARIAKLRSTPEEYQARQEKELAEKTSRFFDALDYTTGKQFGKYFSQVHTREKTSVLNRIEQHIAELYAEGIGACYSGGKGSGKSHAILEVYKQIAWREWQDEIITNYYPDPFEFIEKTCHFIHITELIERIEKKQPVRISRYNFIDDFGSESPPPHILAGLEFYINQIYIKGLALIVSSNLNRDDLDGMPQYERIVSRLFEKVKFYNLPKKDRRKEEPAKPILTWRG